MNVRVVVALAQFRAVNPSLLAPEKCIHMITMDKRPWSFRKPSRLVLTGETSSLKYYRLNQNGWSELEVYLFTH